MQAALKAIDASWINDPDLWRQLRGVIVPVVEPLFREAFIVGAEMGAMENPAPTRRGERALIQHLKARIAHGRRAIDSNQDTVLPYDFEATLTAAQDIIGGYTDAWWEQFSATTQRQLRDVITRAEANGWTTRQVTEQLVPIFGEARAENIAVSELTNLMGKGAQETYRRAGFTRWEWRTVMDSKVDPICSARSHVRYPMYVPFQRAHPRCRCVVEGTMVRGDEILSAMRRRHEGLVITIRTASGNLLTVTPNHPIATASGWLAAADLREGMDVFSDDLWGERDGLVDPRDVQRPTSVENVWDALRKSPYGSALAMESHPEDFHGDGGNGQVDVVWADRALRLDGQPAGNQRGIESAFRSIQEAAMLPRQRRESQLSAGQDAASDAFVSAFSLQGASLAVALIPSQFPRLASTARDNPSSLQARLNGEARYAEAAREFGDARTALVGSHDPIGIYDTNVAVLDKVARSKLAPQNRLRDAGEDRVERFPVDVSLDRIVEISFRSFSGHVFNLETADGWYASAGIVSHNCWPVPAGKPSVQGLLIPGLF